MLIFNQTITNRGDIRPLRSFYNNSLDSLRTEFVQETANIFGIKGSRAEEFKARHAKHYANWQKRSPGERKKAFKPKGSPGNFLITVANA